MCERGLVLGSVVGALAGLLPPALLCTRLLGCLGQRRRLAGTDAACRSLTGLPLPPRCRLQIEWSQSESECPIMGDLSLTMLTFQEIVSPCIPAPIDMPTEAPVEVLPGAPSPAPAA